MLNGQFKITVEYHRLKKYLVEQLGYSPRTAALTIADIRRMEPTIRRAFLIWFTTGKKPQGELCGVNYANLLAYRQLNPVSAFLAIDWYVKDPQAAYATLAMPMKDRAKAEPGLTGEQFNELLRELSGTSPEAPENAEDISE